MKSMINIQYDYSQSTSLQYYQDQHRVSMYNTHTTTLENGDFKGDRRLAARNFRNTIGTTKANEISSRFHIYHPLPLDNEDHEICFDDPL